MKAIKATPQGHQRRANRSREAIIEAAIIMLGERGTAGFTIDALVERTGIAKTTIYRHWPSRSDLLAATMGRLAGDTLHPDTGTVRGDLLEFFTIGSRNMEGHVGNRHLKNLPMVLEATRTDPDLHAVGVQVMNVSLDAVKNILQRGRRRGEVRTDRDLDAMAQALLGAALIHRGFLGKENTVGYLTEVVDIVLEGIKPQNASTGPKRVR